MRHPLLWIIVPGIIIIVASCAYSGNGPASITIYRELGIDSTISAAMGPASAPSAPKGK